MEIKWGNCQSPVNEFCLWLIMGASAVKLAGNAELWNEKHTCHDMITVVIREYGDLQSSQQFLWCQFY